MRKMLVITITLLIFQISLIHAEQEKAVNFNLRDPWDNKFSLDQFKGKTVILVFFRIYCHGRLAPDTESQIQELNKFCSEFCKGNKCIDGDVVIISITLAACPTTDLKGWAETRNIKWFLGNDYDDYNMDVFESYSKYLSKLQDPALIFINPNQKIAFTSNYLNAPEIKEKINLMQKK